LKATESGKRRKIERARNGTEKQSEAVGGWKWKKWEKSTNKSTVFCYWTIAAQL